MYIVSNKMAALIYVCLWREIKGRAFVSFHTECVNHRI